MANWNGMVMVQVPKCRCYLVQQHHPVPKAQVPAVFLRAQKLMKISTSHVLVHKQRLWLQGVAKELDDEAMVLG